MLTTYIFFSDLGYKLIKSLVKSEVSCSFSYTLNNSDGQKTKREQLNYFAHSKVISLTHTSLPILTPIRNSLGD